MSETDDTDVLLLIPPNFFLVQSSESEDSFLESSRTVVHKPKSCTAQVLGKLVDQVHTLESRLENLEINSDTSSFGTVRRPKTWDTTDSIDSQSLDRKCFTFPRRRKRKTTKKSKRFDLSLSGLDSASTGRKSIPPLKLGIDLDQLNSKPKEIINDIQSMDADLSSIVSTPTKKNDKLLLHEIDEFLTKVESYETPDTKYKDHEPSLSPENVIKATGDYISHKLDSKSNEEEVKLPSGRMVSSSVLDKYIYLVKSNSGTARFEKPTTSENYKGNNEETGASHPESSSKESAEACSRDTRTPSMRKLNFSDKDVQPTSTPKRPQSSYLDTFRPSSNKIYDRASKVLEQYKSQSHNRNQGSVNDSYLSPKKEEFKMPQMRPYCYSNKEAKLSSLQNRYMESIDTDLLSLSELWGDRGDRPERIDSVKLEEERLKREHCESMIQQLQKKILEQQEKLAVAVKVDRAKDAAIGKLREAWLKLTGSLDKAEERHRAALEKMDREVENFRMIADEAQKKTSHFEAELYKALDLAHDYQEKCKQLTAEKKEIDEKILKTVQDRDEMVAMKDKEVEALKENCQTIMRLNKQSTDCIKNLEEALEKEKADHHETKSKIKELANKIQSLEDTNSLITQERDLLKEKVNEERSRNNLLEKQMGDQQNHTAEVMRKCDNLETEVKTLRKHLELQKTELKCHYQKQLEDAVLSKLQEFQQQLDVAERDMEADARAKENALIDTYNKQICRIEEQHKLEVNVMEEKQREEIKLYRLQLAQAGEKIGLLESKLESFRRRRGALAGQLHAVLQAQCRAAIRLLTHGDSRGSHVSEYTKIPPLTLPERGLVRSEARCDGRSDNRTDNNSDERLDGRSDERHDKLNFDGLTDTELQQYVKLLLTKAPNFDGSGDMLELYRELSEEPTIDRPDRSDTAERPEQPERRDKRRLSKPPWKA
ncbi:trichohyalin isoform X2 [Spodoptera litura]|uniref:Trichohyalin isoform X2 n=1 Tax=Spodoptera litura TaxID=69820 RepID=A0A9J7E7D2_SPOLT|nr:trichohyalin isoform X2 [Spodoptera litura]